MDVNKIAEDNIEANIEANNVELTLNRDSKGAELKSIDKLVKNGQPTFGVFDRVQEVNYLDYQSYLLSGKSVSQWRKKLRVNQFCFVHLVQPPYRVCVAVATLNWVTSSFCYLYNSETDEMELVEALQPFTRHTEFNQSTYTDRVCFKSGKLSVQMDFSQEALSLIIDSKIVTVDAQMSRHSQPLSVCTPTGKTGWTYTQKEPMKQINGSLTVADKNIELAGATAMLDWSVGYLRRVTNWWWTSIVTQLADGRHFGLNLATGVNESGASENAMWLDGVRYHLPAVLFERKQLDSTQLKAMKPELLDIESEQSEQSMASQKDSTDDSNNNKKEIWSVRNQPLNWSKVKVELTFRPVRCYKKSDRLIVVDSIFEQWVGYYSGTIEFVNDAGEQEVITLDDVMGLSEDHYAKW